MSVPNDVRSEVLAMYTNYRFVFFSKARVIPP